MYEASVTQLSHQLLIDQKHRREMLMKVLTSLRFLLHQGLATRGHREEDSNLIQLLKCQAEDIHGLECWIKDGRYLSHDIINELIEMMAHQLLRTILGDIKSAKWFALILSMKHGSLVELSNLQCPYDGLINVTLFMRMSSAWFKLIKQMLPLCLEHLRMFLYVVVFN